MRGQTYTPRTRWISVVYAVLCKSLWYIVGLGRVELPTSRLSGPLVRKGSASVHGEFAPAQTSRLFRRERIRAQKPPPARTQGVHAKALGADRAVRKEDWSLTNLFQRNRAGENARIPSSKERQEALQAAADRTLDRLVFGRPS